MKIRKDGKKNSFSLSNETDAIDMGREETRTRRQYRGEDNVLQNVFNLQWKFQKWQFYNEIKKTTRARDTSSLLYQTFSLKPPHTHPTPIQSNPLLPSFPLTPTHTHTSLLFLLKPTHPSLTQRLHASAFPLLYSPSVCLSPSPSPPPPPPPFLRPRPPEQRPTVEENLARAFGRAGVFVLAAWLRFFVLLSSVFHSDCSIPFFFHFSLVF